MRENRSLVSKKEKATRTLQVRIYDCYHSGHLHRQAGDDPREVSRVYHKIISVYTRNKSVGQQFLVSPVDASVEN